MRKSTDTLPERERLDEKNGETHRATHTAENTAKVNPEEQKEEGLYYRRVRPIDRWFTLFFNWPDV